MAPMYNTIVQTQLRSIATAKEEINAASQRVTTGKKVNTPMDNPVIWDISQRLLNKSQILEGINQNLTIVGTNLNKTSHTIKYLSDNISLLESQVELMRVSSPIEIPMLIERYNRIIDQIDSETIGNKDINVRNILGNVDKNQSIQNSESTRIEIPHIPLHSGALGLNRINGVADFNILEEQIYNAKNIVKNGTTRLEFTQIDIANSKKYNDSIRNTSMDGYTRLTETNIEEDVALIKSLETKHALGIQIMGITHNMRQQLLKLLG
jgi:flagellin